MVAGIFSFLLFVLLGFFLLWQRYQIFNKGEEQEMATIFNLVENNIQHSLQNSYSVAFGLVLLIDEQGDINKFDEIAPQFVAGNPDIDIVQLLPDGIITWMYPLEGNRVALNLNVLKDSTRRREAVRAIEERKMYFAGPFELKQGGKAVAGRLPVFVNHEFWGFSSVIIKLETLLKNSGIHELQGDKYQYQFSKVDLETGVETFYLPELQNLKRSFSRAVVWPDGRWKLYIVPRNPEEFLYLIFPTALLILILSGFLAWIIVNVLRQPERLQALLELKTGDLLQSELKFRAIFDQAAIGIARIDLVSGKIMETNAKYSELLGYSREELSELDYIKLIHPEDAEEDVNNLRKLTSGEIKEYTIRKRIISKKGVIVWIKLTASTLWENDSRPNEYVTLIEDITKKKLAESNLKKSLELVTDQNKRLLNFSFIVSHNLRSHSSNIQSILDLYNLAESNEERESYIKLLSKVSVALDQTLIDLNEVVSIQTNTNLVVEPLCVSEYLKRTLNLLEVQIQEKNAIIHQEIPEEMQVDFNAAYLESVLLNFMSNALRYVDSERTPEISVSGTRENGHWVLQISDNGIGVDLDLHGEQLFGLYKTFSDKPYSKGVGLFIVKNQLEAMGGSVDVESTVNVGTTFKIHFK